MDIKKEREEFELNISPVIWERIEYNAENNIYMAKSKYWTSSIVQAVANEIDFGWKMWQAAKAQAVPEGFVLVEIKDLRDVISNAGDAMMNEETSSVYDITGEPSTWFDHYTVAEKQVLKAIELQEQNQ